MAISDYPVNLQDIIQQNMLEREFVDGLQSDLAYRNICDKESFPVADGETITKTRTGFLNPVENPLNPATNTNLDNGLTPAQWTVEQYTMALNMFGLTMDLNVVTQKVGIRNRFITNANKLGVNAKQSLDRVARNTLFDAYLGGNTYVRTTLGAPGTTVAVNDIRGFTTLVVDPSTSNPGSGTVQPVSSTNPLAVVVGSNVYNVIGFTVDTQNVSTAFRGISGSLVFSTNVSVADGTLGKPVVSNFAPIILRPNARATTRDLLATDLMTMSIVMDAVTELRNNAVPDINGRYNMYLDNRAARQLFADPEFQVLYRGQYDSDAYLNLDVLELLDVRYIRTTEAPQQNITNASSAIVKVHRPILCGQGALIEGQFQGLTDSVQNMGDNEEADIMVEDGIAMVTRPPIDRLRQIVSQSWYSVMGYTVPTDVTATQNIIPTANKSYLKRAVMLEVGSA
jgi:hypothetical protein